MNPDPISCKKMMCSPQKFRNNISLIFQDSNILINNFPFADEFSHRTHLWKYVDRNGDSNLLNPDVCTCMQPRGQPRSCLPRWKDTETITDILMLNPAFITNFWYLNNERSLPAGKVRTVLHLKPFCGFICLGNAGKFLARNLSTWY